MFGRLRLAEAREDLATLRTKYNALRHQYAEKTAECATWRASADRMADQLIVRTRERDTAVRELAATANDLAAARKRLAVYGHPQRLTVSDVLEQHDVHRKALADALGPQKWHLNWEQLLTEVACVLAGDRKEAAEQKAVIERLTGQLFDAFGYDAAQRDRLDMPPAEVAS